MNAATTLEELIAQHAYNLNTAGEQGHLNHDLQVKMLDLHVQATRARVVLLHERYFMPYAGLNIQPPARSDVLNSVAVALHAQLTRTTLLKITPEKPGEAISSFSSRVEPSNDTPYLMRKLIVDWEGKRNVGLEGFLYQSGRLLSMYDYGYDDLLAAYGAVMAKLLRGDATALRAWR